MKVWGLSLTSCETALLGVLGHLIQVQRGWRRLSTPPLLVQMLRPCCFGLCLRRAVAVWKFSVFLGSPSPGSSSVLCSYFQLSSPPSLEYMKQKESPRTHYHVIPLVSQSLDICLFSPVQSSYVWLIYSVHHSQFQWDGLRGKNLEQMVCSGGKYYSLKIFWFSS